MVCGGTSSDAGVAWAMSVWTEHVEASGQAHLFSCCLLSGQQNRSHRERNWWCFNYFLSSRYSTFIIANSHSLTIALLMLLANSQVKTPRREWNIMFLSDLWYCCSWHPSYSSAHAPPHCIPDAAQLFRRFSHFYPHSAKLKGSNIIYLTLNRDCLNLLYNTIIRSAVNEILSHNFCPHCLRN